MVVVVTAQYPHVRLARYSGLSGGPIANRRRWSENSKNPQLVAFNRSRISAMRIHKNARLTISMRAELARKVVHEHTPLSWVASQFNVSRVTATKWVRRFLADGPPGLLDQSARPHQSPSKLSPDQSDDDCKAVLVAILHRPPSEFGINRTSWRLVDLHRIARDQGVPLSRARLHRVLRSTGFRWLKARRVLTSQDPEYTTKVTAIKEILANLKPDEVFFSIDEYGPFSIKKKGGRKRVGPNEIYEIPQRQKSKGWLILTAALELTTNQVTHFYSLKKNTDEMIRMADFLRSQYADRRRIYLSWDAASWHVSSRLKIHLEKINSHAAGEFPIVDLAPLPAGAQFLNVIESIFSGMSRAIIHNSDYDSVEAAKSAIDQYFQARNLHFRNEPRRAGQKIWQKERCPAQFSETNTCKDPSYSWLKSRRY
jgi:transposase